MSKQVLLSLLAQGNTGTEILSILDAIVADQSSEQGYNEPTADVIEFWCRRQSVSDTNCVCPGWHWGTHMLLCVRVVVWQLYAVDCL